MAKTIIPQIRKETEIRIVLEETEKSEYPRKLRKVVIEVDYDGLTLNELMEDLVRPALLGLTYTEGQLSDYFGDDE